MTTYVLAPPPAFGFSGVAAYTVNTYEAGNLTPTTTWSDNGVTANANPFTLGAAGSAWKTCFIEAGKSYRFIYKNTSGGTVLDQDNILVPDVASGGTSLTSLTVSGTSTLTGDVTMGDDLTVTDDVTIGGDNTTTGDTLSNGVKLNALPPGFRNGSIDAMAAANAITITYETQASAAPTTTSPVSVVRGSQTITDGATTIVNQTAALSTVISSGSTLGCAASEVVRIHIGLIRNAGSAMELCYWTSAVAASTGIKGFDPSALVTTTAEGGAGGADSAQTVYSTTARTSQPIIYLGYIEATSGSTAGQWASVDRIVNWQPGVPMPGDVVQITRTDTGAVATGTTVIPGDDTIPQITEGDQYMSLSITQKSNLNFIETSVQGFINTSLNNSSPASALFKNGAANAVKAANAGTRDTNPTTNPTLLFHLAQAGSTSPTAFTFRAGPTAAATVTFNGSAGAGAFGGVYNSFMMHEEIHI